jgi:DMSO/TMAO reductase YedYZ molybdopterin-dependent catalytic subunit
MQRLGVGALIGLLAAGIAVGVGEIVAAFVRPAASPVIAVGNRFILLTPEPVKRWAIRQFGVNDKYALLAGIYVGIALLAVVVGLLASRRLVYGLIGIGALGAVGGYSALTAHAHQGGDIVPSVLGAAAGVGALILLYGRAFGSKSPIQRSTGVGKMVADRRQFLQTSVATAGLAAVGGFGGHALQRTRFDASAARAAVTLPTPAQAAPIALTNFDLGKSGVPFLTPAADFYRIDTALSVPQLDPKTWKIRIHGKVDHELTLTYADLLARPLIERWVTLCCVSNEVGGDLIGNAKFLGARLADLLREAGVAPDADQLVATSSDGMTIGSPTAVVMDGRDAMLAVGMNGQPLPTEHGFPVRMVVPGLYGYVSACKWIVDLEATTFAQNRAYWVQGGWAARGPIRLASRIDTPKSSATVAAGSTVPIAGVAWDQHVGVSKVEVQVNDGAWQAARLAPVPSTDTWRQWVYVWTAPSAGAYTLRVRAVDGSGVAQDEAVRAPFPAGASGLHSIKVRVR